jgi:hypothetical protein
LNELSANLQTKLEKQKNLLEQRREKEVKLLFFFVQHRLIIFSFSSNGKEKRVSNFFLQFTEQNGRTFFVAILTNQ